MFKCKLVFVQQHIILFDQLGSNNRPISKAFIFFTKRIVLYEWLPQLLGPCDLLRALNRTCEEVPPYQGECNYVQGCFKAYFFDLMKLSLTPHKNAVTSSNGRTYLLG